MNKIFIWSFILSHVLMATGETSVEIRTYWELDGLKENKVPLHKKVFRDQSTLYFMHLWPRDDHGLV